MSQNQAIYLFFVIDWLRFTSLSNRFTNCDIFRFFFFYFFSFSFFILYLLFYIIIFLSFCSFTNKIFGLISLICSKVVVLKFSLRNYIINCANSCCKINLGEFKLLSYITIRVVEALCDCVVVHNANCDFLISSAFFFCEFVWSCFYIFHEVFYFLRRVCFIP